MILLYSTSPKCHCAAIIRVLGNWNKYRLWHLNEVSHHKGHLCCFEVLYQLQAYEVTEVSIAPFPSPFSSCWWRLLFWRGCSYRNATLASIPLYLLKRRQSVMNSAARLVFSSSRYDIITLLRQLHLVEGSGVNLSQPRSPCLQVSARSCTVIPYQWT